jgi:hypothetical protein
VEDEPERDEDARAAAVREVREESLIEDLHFDWGHASTPCQPIAGHDPG